MVDRIVDWRTPGELHRLNGAKAEQYHAAGYGYEPRGAPFQSVSELLLVLGMTRPLFRCVRPALMIYSGMAGIDPSVAPKRALLALPGMTSERVERMLAARRRTPTGAELARAPRGVVGMVDTASAGHAFTINSRVVLQSGISFEREAVVRMTGDRRNPFWIQAWREPSREVANSTG